MLTSVFPVPTIFFLLCISQRTHKHRLAQTHTNAKPYQNRAAKKTCYKTRTKQNGKDMEFNFAYVLNKLNICEQRPNYNINASGSVLCIAAVDATCANEY